MTRTKRTRRGFTLVEVLVAAALAIWGMWLITWLYQQGLESFRQAHAQSELTNQLRMSKTIMKRDLGASHFLSDDTKPNYGLRLSDQHPELMASGAYVPPTAGFFRAGSPDALQSFEGQDTNGFYSWIAANHFLQFTVILPGGSDTQIFSATVPTGSNNTYFSTAAEVMYYLRPSSLQTPTGNALYDLCRAQRIVAKTTDDQPTMNQILTNTTSPPISMSMGAAVKDANEVVVINTNTNQVATLGGLTIPTPATILPPFPPGTPPVNSVRLSSPPPYPGGLPPPYTNRYGEDKLLSNVISFEVKFTGPTVSGVSYSGAPSPAPAGYSQWPRPISINSDAPYDFLPFDGYFDTGSSQLPSWPNGPPKWAGYLATPSNQNGLIKPIRITGVHIHIRAYDPKTRATRQTTFIVDL